MTKHITKKILDDIASMLSDRDMKILHALHKYRYMTTHHLRRLYFTDCISDVAALRAVNRTLSKLREYGVITHLKRRIGGVRAGSGAFVWALAPAGDRLLQGKVRKRSIEPLSIFLEHTLAVAETAIKLHELDVAKKIILSNIDTEPTCWRMYSGVGGGVKTLKPDMFAITASGEYEDNWFLELDLDTESPSTVLKKCLQYITYYKTGREQKDLGVFPLIVWIVPDGKRKSSLKRHISEGISANDMRLFIVITMNELEPLLIGGADIFNNV